MSVISCLFHTIAVVLSLFLDFFNFFKEEDMGLVRGGKDLGESGKGKGMNIVCCMKTILSIFFLKNRKMWLGIGVGLGRAGGGKYDQNTSLIRGIIKISSYMSL